ncbi:hypothetical protein [Chthoniobacter flavus]|nr:hypothetical protein [Chthoniobacter flavus]
MKFGVYKGPKGVQVLITPAAPTPLLIKDMITSTGSDKSILNGKCFKEESKIIFASKAGENAVQVTAAMKAHATGIAYELRPLVGDDEESTDTTHTGQEGQPQGQVHGQVGQTGQQNTTTTQTTNRPGIGQQGGTQNRPWPPTPQPRTGQPIPNTQGRTGQPNPNTQGRTVPPTPNPQGRTVPPTPNPQGRTVPPTPNPQGRTVPPPNPNPQGRTVPPPNPNPQGRTVPPPNPNPQGRTVPPPNPNPQGRTVPPPNPGQQGGTQNRPWPPTPQNRTGQPIPNTQGRTVPPNPNTQGRTVPPTPNTQGRTVPPNPNPQGRGVPPNPNPQGQGGQQNGGQRQPKDGGQVISQRANSSLQKANNTARTLAQNAFSPQKVQTATTQLATTPVTVDRKVLAKKTSQFKKQGLDKQYIGGAKKPEDKKKREAQVKAERKSAANIAKAMKKASGKKVTPKQLDALELALQQGVDNYNVRLQESVKEAKAKLLRATDDLELEADVAKAEGRPFDSSLLDQAIQEAKDQLENTVSGPEGTRLAETMDAQLETQLRKNAKLIADLTAAVKTAETDKSEKNLKAVRDLARQYRKLFSDHADGYDKLPGRSRPQAIVDQEKAAEEILQDAEASLFEKVQTRLGPPPWDAQKQDEGNELMDRSREIMAKDVLKNGKVSRPSGGSSEVLVLKNAQDKVQFAFKSAKGESSMMGLPKGGGAIREAVTSKVTDAILQQTGFDFGFPKSTIATIGGTTGALVEGIDGKLLPASNELAPEDVATTAVFQDSVPGKQLQKTIFAGLATGNFLDLKWDNVFFEGDGAQMNARPFDAGASFLPNDAIQLQLYGLGRGTPKVGADLLTNAEGKPTKGASEPMDAELVEAMLKIDTNALEKVIDDEVQRHANTGLDKALDDDSKKNGIKCLAALQTILRAHQQDTQPPSLADIMKEVQIEILKLFPKKK